MPCDVVSSAPLARAFLMAALLGGCVGRVVPVPIAVDHPANPAAASGSFRPQRPEFSVESPTWDGAAAPAPRREDPAPGGHDHGAHGGHVPPARPAAAEPGHGDHGVHGETSESSKHEDPSPAKHPAGRGDTNRIDDAVRAYLALARALAADDPAAAEPAKRFRAAARELAGASDATVRDAGVRLVGADDAVPSDLAGVRAAFRAWSPPMIELVQRTPPSASAAAALRVVHCPMAEASWLQESDQVANPYFGAKMLRCGTVTHVVEAREEPGR